MDCRVVVEAAVPVYDVATADEAVRIAISKTGEMLNPELNYVEINMGERSCPQCGDELEPAFIAADEGLVALELEMTVFNVEREEHASRIARKEIGQRLENIPLEVLVVDVVDEDDEDEDEGNGHEDEATDEEDDGLDPVAPGEGGGEDDVLPEFEDLIEDNCPGQRPDPVRSLARSVMAPPDAAIQSAVGETGFSVSASISEVIPSASAKTAALWSVFDLWIDVGRTPSS